MKIKGEFNAKIIASNSHLFGVYSNRMAVSVAQPVAIKMPPVL